MSTRREEQLRIAADNFLFYAWGRDIAVGGFGETEEDVPPSKVLEVAYFAGTVMFNAVTRMAVAGFRAQRINPRHYKATSTSSPEKMSEFASEAVELAHSDEEFKVKLERVTTSLIPKMATRVCVLVEKPESLLSYSFQYAADHDDIREMKFNHTPFGLTLKELAVSDVHDDFKEYSDTQNLDLSKLLLRQRRGSN